MGIQMCAKVCSTFIHWYTGTILEKVRVQDENLENKQFVTPCDNCVPQIKKIPTALPPIPPQRQGGLLQIAG